MAEIKLGAIHEKSLYPPAQTASSGQDLAQARHYRAENIAKTIAWLHEAGRQKLDLVCTRESFSGSDTSLALAEPVPGPLTEELGRISRCYSMYIAANFYERSGGLVYNTSVLIDRQGEILGKYQKVHLPAQEKWTVSAGDQIPVFTTELGRIGFAICYDICFPEHSRALALAGADLVIHQTMGWGGLTSVQQGAALLQTRALDNCFYLLVAKNIQTINSNWASSCLIDNRGNFLAKASGEKEAIAQASLTPDYERLDENHYNSLFSGISSSKARFLLERRPELYEMISQPAPPALAKYHELAGLLNSPAGQAQNKARWQAYGKEKARGQSEREYHW